MQADFVSRILHEGASLRLMPMVRIKWQNKLLLFD